MFVGTLTECEQFNDIQIIIHDNCFKKFNVRTKNRCFKYHTPYYIYNNYSDRYIYLKKPEKCVFVRKYNIDSSTKAIQFQKVSDTGFPTGYINLILDVCDDGYVYGISQTDDYCVMKQAVQMYKYHLNNLYYLNDNYD